MGCSVTLGLGGPPMQAGGRSAPLGAAVGLEPAPPAPIPDGQGTSTGLREETPRWHLEPGGPALDDHVHHLQAPLQPAPLACAPTCDRSTACLRWPAGKSAPRTAASDRVCDKSLWGAGPFAERTRQTSVPCRPRWRWSQHPGRQAWQVLHARLAAGEQNNRASQRDRIENRHPRGTSWP